VEQEAVEMQWVQEYLQLLLEQLIQVVVEVLDLMVQVPL
jgi:hypothetical protein